MISGPYQLYEKAQQAYKIQKETAQKLLNFECNLKYVLKQQQITGFVTYK